MDPLFTADVPLPQDSEAVAALDELPLWSAPFGLALLDRVALRRGLCALDVGCGTGFPLLELAQRLGTSSPVHGVDTWPAALDRVRSKLRFLGLENVLLHEAQAERLPLASASVDLVVSNNGFNNVEDEEQAFAEAARVARPGAQLVYAWNLPETMVELYDAWKATLRDAGRGELIEAVDAHVFSKRKPVSHVRAVMEGAGFDVRAVQEGAFRLRYADARALFEHHFVRLAFLPPWLEVLPPELRAPIFGEVAARLDAAASPGAGVVLTVPWAVIEAVRV